MTVRTRLQDGCPFSEINNRMENNRMENKHTRSWWMGPKLPIWVELTIVHLQNIFIIHFGVMHVTAVQWDIVWQPWLTLLVYPMLNIYARWGLVLSSIVAIFANLTGLY